MRALFIALAVAGFALLPAVSTAQESGTEPVEGVRIERVEIVGNQRVEDEAIRIKLKERSGGTYDPQAVDDDIRAIYKMGFFNDVRANMDRQQGVWVLTYDVHERPFIRQVHIEGNKKIDTEELEGMLHVRPTTILDPEKARQGIEEAKSAYEKKGYLDADLRYETTPVGENEVDVTFIVDEREPVRIQHIVFEGNTQFTESDLKKVMQTGERGILSPITGPATSIAKCSRPTPSA